MPGLPFKSFAALQKAIAEKTHSVGIDSVAAAEWADTFLSGFKRAVISALSLMLIAVGIAALVAAFYYHNYWMLAAIPIQAMAFYFSHPSSPLRKWVTVAGAVSIIACVELLINGMPTAALLVAYAGLTFAAVRASGYLTGSAFRKAILADEKLFLAAYGGGACTVRDNETKRVYHVDGSRIET